MPDDAKFWDRIAERYSKSPIRDEAAYATTMDRVSSYLASDQSVLEIGAGTGTTAVRLAPMVNRILATDVSENMLKIADQRAKEAGAANMSTVQASAETLPQGPFDVLLAFNLLHLVPDLGAAMEAVAQRVPTGGVFISKTPCLNSGGKKWKTAMFRLVIPLMQWIGKAPGTVLMLTVEDMDASVQAAGFEILETGNYPEDPPSRFIVARRV